MVKWKDITVYGINGVNFKSHSKKMFKWTTNADFFEHV